MKVGLTPIFIAAIISSTVFYSRNIYAVPDQSYLQVFIWQLTSLLPWLAIMPLTRIHLNHGTKTPLSWIVISFLVTFGCTVWFIVISDQISPYLGQPETMFGLFKWFLIFWFAASFLLFWAHLGFYLLQEKSAAVPAVTTPVEDQRRVAIWHNGTHIVVPKSEIVWIEAKDYYAQIYLLSGQNYWVKMRLNQLMKELASDSFVRAHRSAMINVDHLERIDRSSEGYWEATMKGDYQVRVSRAGKTRLDEALNLIR